MEERNGGGFLSGILPSQLRRLVARVAPEAIQQTEFLVGDGRLGVAKFGPYNAIHIGAAAPHIPAALVEQLAVGGRMVIPVGPEGETQYLMEVDKNSDGTVHTREVTPVMFVPLTSLDKQLDGR